MSLASIYLLTQGIPEIFAKKEQIIGGVENVMFFCLTVNIFNVTRMGQNFDYYPGQGLLKLLWTVHSEGKLQSCLESRNLQNDFNKEGSVGL